MRDARSAETHGAASALGHLQWQLTALEDDESRRPPLSAVAPGFSPTVGLAFRQDPSVEVMPPDTNRRVAVAGLAVRLGRRQPSSPTCQSEVLAAVHRLTERTGDEVFPVATVQAEMANYGARYKENTVYKTMQRMLDGDPVTQLAILERVGRHGFRLCRATSPTPAPR